MTSPLRKEGLVVGCHLVAWNGGGVPLKGGLVVRCHIVAGNCSGVVVGKGGLVVWNGGRVGVTGGLEVGRHLVEVIPGRNRHRLRTILIHKFRLQNVNM